jgi:hypothetical protein
MISNSHTLSNPENSILSQTLNFRLAYNPYSHKKFPKNFEPKSRTLNQTTVTHIFFKGLKTQTLIPLNKKSHTSSFSYFDTVNPNSETRAFIISYTIELNASSGSTYHTVNACIKKR